MVHGRYTSPGDRSLHVYLGDDDDKGHKVRRRQKSHALQAACVTIAALCGLLCLWGYPGAQGTPGGHTPKLHGLHSDSLAQATTGAVRTRADPFTSGAADGASSVIPSVVTSGSVGGGASPGGVVHPETLRRLLVASHGRLQWLDVDTGEADVIHEGRGVYYGLAPDGKGPHSGRVWVVSRPHNWRVPDGAKEAALLLDTQSGALLREVTLPSLFTHDMVRCGDKVYLADTGHGTVWELRASDMSILRELQLFTVQEHVNTLACWPSWPGAAEADAGSPHVLVAVLHNLGPSQLAQVDLSTGTVARRLTKVGDKSHGLSLWLGKYAIMLSSGQGCLIQVDLAAATAQGEAYTPTVLWEDPTRTFMKGLSVIENVAYFGISSWGSRQERDDVGKASEVAAFDLVARKLLWRRPVHTKGLLNMVAAPQLSEASTGVAQPSWHADAPLGEHYLEPGAVEVSDGTRMVRLLPAMPYQAWDPSTGPPRQIPIDNKRVAAATHANLLPANVLGNNAFVPLRHVDIAPLVRELSARAREGLWDVDRAAASNAVLVGREDNMARYKPGVQTVHFIFSDNAATQCYFFPWWTAWKPHVLPVICEILGWYGIPEGQCEARIVRLQLARMGPGGAILKHSDTGRWASGLHRIHVPLITNPEVHFLFQADSEGNLVEIPVAPGNVFEINNVVPHQVHNSNHQERVHLLLDFAEQGMECGQLAPGQKCNYKGMQGIVC